MNKYITSVQGTKLEISIHDFKGHVISAKGIIVDIITGRFDEFTGNQAKQNPIISQMIRCRGFVSQKISSTLLSDTKIAMHHERISLF